MTNFDRIKKMNLNQFIMFLKMCDFSGIFPVIEGRRFHNREELIAWFSKEVDGNV